MFVKILLILVGAYIAFEIIEHLVVPLVWLLMGKKKKALTGTSGLIGEIAEVKEWNESEGIVFVHGEIWKAECDVILKPGDRAVITAVQGLTLKVSSCDQT